MATRSLGSLTLDLIAKIGGFIGPMDKASRNAKKNSKDISDSLKGIGVAAGAMGVAAAAGFAAMAKASLNAADELYKQSQVVGVSVEQLSALKFTAGEAGVEFGALTGSLGKFNKNISDALLTGVGPAAEAFADLGIELKGADGELKSTYQLFEEVTGALSSMRDGALKTALAQDLLGKSGKELIPLINGGVEGLRAGADEAQRLGQVMGTEAAKAAERFNDNLSRLQKSITGAANVAAMEAAPALAEMTDVFADPEVQQGIALMAKGLVDVGTAAVKALAEVGNFARWVGEEVAAQINGPLDDDVVRLEDLLEELKKKRDTSALSTIFGGAKFGVTGGVIGVYQAITKDSEALAKSIEETEQKIDAAYERMADSAKKARDAMAIGEFDEFGWADAFEEIKNGIEILTEEEIERRRVAREAEEEKQKLLAETNAAYEQTRAALQKEIDLWGNKSAAVELAYDLEHGLIKGLDADRQKQLVALQEQIDLMREQAALMEELDQFGWEAAFEDIPQKASEFAEDAAERINSEFAKAWANIGDGFDELTNGVKNAFTQMLAEMAHDAITKPIVMNVQQKLSSLGGGTIAGLPASGVVAAGVLVGGALISEWNKSMDEKFEKMTAEYRQGNQSLGTILGEQNKKSESLNSSIQILSNYSSDTLSVNNQMYKALLDIREGINGVAAGFARQFGINGLGDFSDIQTGTTTSKYLFGALDAFGGATNILGDEIGNFIDGVIGGVSKAIYSKKRKIIDTGIGFMGQSLADILETGVVDAFAYAEVETKRKTLGITTSKKVRTEKEALDELLLLQFGQVFESASDALEEIAPLFGRDFAEASKEMMVDAQRLSLKGLEGDELTAEIEAFFSSTLDGWASVLLGTTKERVEKEFTDMERWLMRRGADIEPRYDYIETQSDILLEFQKVGEGAFETVIRLASETMHFTEVADMLGLNFQALGLDAIYATQAIADAAGGFDSLSGSLSSYADKFFSDTEKFEAMQDSIGEAFGELGVALPKTRDEFRALIEGLDLASEAGQKQFAALIGLTDATDSYLTALEREAKAKEDIERQAQEALRSAAGSAFEAFSKSIKRDMDLVEEALGSSRQVADSLTGALRSMYLETERDDLMLRRAAQAQLFTANAIRKAGGPLPGVGQLDDALAVLTQPSQQLFGSFEDYARDFYKTQNQIKELEEAAGLQVTIDEQNLAALQESLDYYQKQIDLLDGIDSSVLSVRDSVLRLNQTLIDAGIDTAAPVIPVLSNDYENRQIAQYSNAVANATGSSANLNSGVSAKNSADITALLELLLEKVDGGLFAIAKSSSKTTKIVERWDEDGLPAERTDE
jgi:hypothetical protein